MSGRDVTRRAVLRLAGAASLSVAMAGALRAEGGSVLDMLMAFEEKPFAGDTPISIGAAALRVRDLDNMVTFYRIAIGLEVISQDADGAVMGVGGRPLLHLISRPDAPRESPINAGLYHIAFLMPSRADLARWLVHSVYREIPLTGLADHSVSEAIYLDDPEGNGLEIYADRPRGTWQWAGGNVAMGTLPLDVDGLLALVNTSVNDFDTAPEGMFIGHVHLRVGDIATGRAFYEDALGFEHMVEARRDSAFLASGGYHHHLALNIWGSVGAGPRKPETTGLDWFSLAVRDEDVFAAQVERLRGSGRSVTEIEGGVAVSDPWGTVVRVLRV